MTSSQWSLLILLILAPDLIAEAGPLDDTARTLLQLPEEVRSALTPAEKPCDSTLSAVVAPQVSEAICREQDLKNKDIPSIQNCLNNYGTGMLLKTRVNCGLPGEHFEVCSSCSDEITSDMMSAIRPMLATTHHRRWHADWHQFRLSAAQLLLHRKHPQLPGLNKEIAKGLEQRGYLDDNLENFVTHHSGQTDADGKLLRDDDYSGEDFFYMHREMIKMVQLKLAFAGQPCIRGFHPAPTNVDDPSWPAPRARPGEPAYLRSEAEEHLSEIGTWDRKLRDPTYLRTVSLSQLGSDVDRHPHTLLHEAYENSKDHCKGTRDALESDESCDDLLSPWSGPVNKHFWKIHGYVDDFIGLWLKEHPEFTEIAADCHGRKGCYAWKGTWIGKPPN